ncbi:MAG: tRNA (5-methylaminomethyl-2-thiouridine)(34)-methyltransferase MnmD, partial [Capnocytophaga granulosa]
MKRKIIYTQDGSTTLEIEAWGEHYHSMRGAIGEAYHVFIHQGLELFAGKKIFLLEIGLGTGLNAFITFLEHERLQQTIHYEGVEAYPLTAEEVACLNYPELLHVSDKKAVFELLHSTPWDETVSLSPTFTLKKRLQSFEQISDQERFDLIYFDAFSASVQPELWTETLFERMY